MRKRRINFGVMLQGAERGYHDMAQCGTTLRDYFGLPYRESRHVRVQPAGGRRLTMTASRGRS